MTVVAYKDGVLAADKQSTFAGLRRTTTKIARLPDGRLFGAAGNSSKCRALLQWFEKGDADAKYPDDKNECMVLIVNLDGSLVYYDDGPTPILLEDPFTAIGSGRDYAMGAMDVGASAVKAVDVACKYDTGCGQGVDLLRLKTGATQDRV